MCATVPNIAEQVGHAAEGRPARQAQLSPDGRRGMTEEPFLRPAGFVGLLGGRRRGSNGLEPPRLGLETDRSTAAAATTPATAPVPSRGGTARLRRRGAGKRPSGEPVEGDPERRGDITHRVERSIVRHDLEHVPGARAGEPYARAHGDPEVAPVADAGGRGTMKELGPEPSQDTSRLVADHAPVADGEEFSAPADVIDRQTPDDALDVRGVARVLDVEEDRVAGRRPQPIRSGRWYARREHGLGRDNGQRGGRLGRRDGRRRRDLRAGGDDLRDSRLRGSASATFASGRRSFHARIIRDATPSGQTRSRHGRVYRRRRHRQRASRDAEEPFGPAGPRPRGARGESRALVLLRDRNGRRRLQAPRDVRQGPMHLPEHVHDAAEGLGDRRALTPQRIELALERAMDTA